MDTFTYKDGTLYTIEVDIPNRDIYVYRDKAGNVRTWVVKQYGVGLIRDELVVNISEQLRDSEGDPIPIPPNRLDIIVRDQEYFNDLNAYTQNGAVANAKLFVDVLLKQRLEQTRVYAPDGTFVAPVYFQVEGVDPTTPGGNDGEITVTILQANGYADLQARFRQDGGAWSAWSNITTPITLQNRTAGFFEVEVRSLGTSLLIVPVESVTLVDPIVE